MAASQREVRTMPFDTPYVHSTQIRFGDTDAAQIAYTGRFPQLALDAIDGWFRERLDTDWYRLNIDEKIGTPFVHLSVDMRSPLTPRDVLATTVLVAKAGNASVEFSVIGRVGARVSFEGRFVCVFVDLPTGKPMRIPDRYRAVVIEEAALAANGPGRVG
jgi:acyl-CoA thioesterase FadM